MSSTCAPGHEHTCPGAVEMQVAVSSAPSGLEGSEELKWEKRPEMEPAANA